MGLKDHCTTSTNCFQAAKFSSLVENNIRYFYAYKSQNKSHMTCPKLDLFIEYSKDYSPMW